MEYSFSQTFGRGTPILPHPDNPTAFKPATRPQLKSASSCKYLSKNKYQERGHEISQQIRNVEGLNERMVNLIQELRREHSREGYGASVRKDSMDKEARLSKQGRGKENVRIPQRSNQGLGSVKKQTKLQHSNRLQNKYAKYFQRQPKAADSKIQLINQKLNSQVKTLALNQPPNPSPCPDTAPKYYISTQSHNYSQFRSRIRTIQSQIQTNYIQQKQQDSVLDVDEISVVEMAHRETDDEESICRMLDGRCGQCGLRSRPEGIGEKIMRINQKIQSYQRKVERIEVGQTSSRRSKDELRSDSVRKRLAGDELKSTVKSKHARKETPNWASYTLSEEVSPQNARARAFVFEDQKSLKQRMAIKLGGNEVARKLTKQIMLDQQFRKMKKQFSKLPDEVPNSQQTKWSYLSHLLQPQMKTRNKFFLSELKKIFELSDEQADPFYSISIENLREYQRIVEDLANAYLESEAYFQQNIKNALALSQFYQVFQSALMEIEVKLDELTLILSNTTKVTYKCRDIVLLFHRLLNCIREKDAKSEGSVLYEALKYALVRKDQESSFENKQPQGKYPKTELSSQKMKNVREKRQQAHLGLDSQSRGNFLKYKI